MERINVASVYAAFLGLDWADGEHLVALQITSAVSDNTNTVESIRIKQTAEEVHGWIASLRERFGGRPVALAVEQNRGPIMHALMAYDFIVIYPINPKALARYRDALRCSGAKDDPADAELLLHFLRAHIGKLRGWVPDDELTRELRLMVEFRRKEVDAGTRLCNRLISCLKQYFPQAFDLVSDLKSLMACEFLSKWPTLADLQKIKSTIIRGFYNRHNVRSKDLLNRRLEMIKTARVLTADPAIVGAYSFQVKALVRNLEQVICNIQGYDKRIDELFQRHPDRQLYETLPGVGPVFASRLAAAWGTDRERYSSAKEVQMFVGTAPVTIQSGKSSIRRRRLARPRFVHQTHLEFAALTLKESRWAKAYYDDKKPRLGHYGALRSLAYKWDRIIFRCWKDNTPYEEEKYIQSLIKHGSRFAKILNLQEATQK